MPCHAGQSKKRCSMRLRARRNDVPKGVGAIAIVKSLSALGLPCRIGLHTGECEVRQGQLQGIALHIAARVAGSARPRTVFVSQTVKDLVAGSGIRFTDAGHHVLKGLPEQWRLYEVTP